MKQRPVAVKAADLLRFANLCMATSGKECALARVLPTRCVRERSRQEASCVCVRFAACYVSVVVNTSIPDSRK